MLLLTLTLPLPGLAALGRAQAPCPMQADQPQAAAESGHHAHHGETRHAAAEPAPEAAHDCCDDAHAMAPGGQACKPGQHCQSVTLTLSLPSAAAVRAAPPTGENFGPPDRGAPPQASHTPIWRPPAV
ncbi:MAG: hypothetical protein RIB46_08900 [Pseudomonadales bacterium]